MYYMTRHCATRIRVYPSAEQEEMFRRIAGCCRLVYNLALEQRREFWRNKQVLTGSGFSWIDQKRELPELKAEFPFLKEVPAHCLQMALKDLDRAYKNFFRGHAAYPKPRRKFANDSFIFPDPQQIHFSVSGGWLVLPKFGRTSQDSGSLKARFHRVPYGKLKSVTISREGEHWYASLLMETKRTPRRRAKLTAEDVVGVDRGVSVPFMLSNGKACHVPGPSEREREREIRLERSVARKTGGSKNRARALGELRRHRARVKRRRRDALHKITNHLAKNHGGVVIENLRVKAMTASARGTKESPGSNVRQKTGLNRAVLEVGWGEFRRQLAYKMAWAGGRVIEVRPQHTSCTCAACGVVNAVSRQSQSQFACVACGHADNADSNAALEIRRRGLDILGLQQDTSTPAGTVGSARGALCSGMAMKREEQKIEVNPVLSETG